MVLVLKKNKRKGGRLVLDHRQELYGHQCLPVANYNIAAVLA